jgi:TldD protein
LAHNSGGATRRDFLAATSLAVAGTILGARQLRAGVPVQIPANSNLTANAFMELSLTAPDLQALALRAVDAAQQAGAAYADVRMSVRDTLSPANFNWVTLQTEFTFGIRALVDGVWGFTYGRVPTSEAVAQGAVDAVSSARTLARVGSPAAIAPNWAPAPVATGEWRTPIVVDPFTIPVQQQIELRDAVGETVSRTPGGQGGFTIEWRRETRVFAATTGSLTTQYWYQALPRYEAAVTYGRSSIQLRVPGFHWAAAGYELVSAPNLLEQFKQAAEEATWLAQLPLRPMDVGRYPLVFDGAVMANAVVSFIGQAAELDRVLGLEADASGSSKLTPDLLGSTVMSPLVTVTGHRDAPSIAAVKWDDEGVVAQQHTVIQDGKLLDYHTNLETVSAVRQWYERQGRPVRSNGCMAALEAKRPPVIRSPHLVMAPSASYAPFDDLYKEMKKGVVVMTNSVMLADQQLASGSITGGMMFEVSNGKIVRRLKDMQLHFNTRSFLKAISAIGDMSTVRHEDVYTSKGMPWDGSRQSATAPAALFKEVNVVSAK